MRTLTLSLAFFLTIISFAGFTKAENPVEILKETSAELLDAIAKDKKAFKLDQQKLHKLVDEILFPHVDITTMSRSVLPREVWLDASKQEREEFSKEFTKLLVKTYGSALIEYTNEKVEFFDLREAVEELPDRSRVQVKSRIIRQDGPTIPVNYRLILRGNSWLVYDFSVEGISLVQSFRAQFRSELNKPNVELADLTKKLAGYSGDEIKKIGENDT